MVVVGEEDGGVGGRRRKKKREERAASHQSKQANFHFPLTYTFTSKSCHASKKCLGMGH